MAPRKEIGESWDLDQMCMRGKEKNRREHAHTHTHTHTHNPLQNDPQRTAVRTRLAQLGIG